MTSRGMARGTGVSLSSTPEILKSSNLRIFNYLNHFFACRELSRIFVAAIYPADHITTLPLIRGSQQESSLLRSFPLIINIDLGPRWPSATSQHVCQFGDSEKGVAELHRRSDVLIRKKQLVSPSHLCLALYRFESYSLPLIRPLCPTICIPILCQPQILKSKGSITLSYIICLSFVSSLLHKDSLLFVQDCLPICLHHLVIPKAARKSFLLSYSQSLPTCHLLFQVIWSDIILMD